MGNHTPNPSRRAVLGMTAAAAIARPALAAPAPHPDAELFAACERFEVLLRRWWKILAEPDETFAGQDTVDTADLAADAWWPVLHAVCLHRARTIDGVLAKARVIALHAGKDTDAFDEAATDPNGCEDERLVASLLRDLTVRR